MIPRHMDRRLNVLDFDNVLFLRFLLYFSGSRIRPLPSFLGLR